MSEKTPAALYRVFGAEDMLLYVGISEDFGTRWKQHAKIQPWWDEKRRLTVDWHESRPEAEAAERAAIKAEKPKYNLVHAVTAEAAERRRRRRPAASLPAARRVPPGGLRLSIPRLEQMEPLASLAGFSVLSYFPVPEAGDPGIEAWAAGLYADLTLAHARGLHRMGAMLENSRDAERIAGTPEAAAVARKFRRGLYGFTGIPCPRCSGAPPSGMTCLECGSGAVADAAA